MLPKRLASLIGVGDPEVSGAKDSGLKVGGPERGSRPRT